MVFAPPRCARFRLISMAAAGCALAASTALADAPPRIPGAQIAANGPDPNDPNVTVSEPAVACSSDASLAVVVFRVDEPGTQRVGFAIWNSGKWTEEGLIASGPNEPTIVARPTLAYDADNHAAGEEFLAAAVARGAAGERRLVTARFAGGAFDDWESIAVDASSPWDFPRLIAGEWLATGREYYLFWTDDGSFQYRRSTDSGGAWLGGQVEVSGSPVPGYAWASPASADADVYVAYTHDKGESSGKIELRFLHGADIDDPNDPDDGKVLFAKLIGVSSPPPGGPSGPSGPGSQPPLKLSLKHAQGDAGDWLPGAFSPLTLPTLLADPTDDERLFLVYHDLAAANPAAERGDLNVYMRTITKDGADWQAGERVQVNDNLDDPNDLLDPNDPNGPAHHSDQFLPAATVDKHGNVHVVFYDDRRYRQLDDPNAAPPPRFDVFYAFSDDHGATFTNGRLGKFNDPNQPAMSYAAGRARFGPGDYLSLAANAGQTWAAYGGHAPDDDPNLEDAPCVYAAPTPIRLTPTIDPFETADTGDVDETDIAVTHEKVCAVYHKDPGPGGRQIHRAIRDIDGDPNDWVAGPVDPNSPNGQDPSIAGDPSTGKFIAMRMTSCSTGGFGFPRCLNFVSDYDPNTDLFSPWEELWNLGEDNADKPWMLLGEPREYYVLSGSNSSVSLSYAHSIDGGLNWAKAPVRDENQDLIVSHGFAQPCTARDGGLFIAYTHSVEANVDVRYRFLEGTDQVPDPNDPDSWTVSFMRVRDASMENEELEVVAAWAVSDLDAIEIPSLPYPAGDPTCKNDRFFFVYDSDGESSDILCNRLTRRLGSSWHTSIPKRINQSSDGDQDKPAATVDRFGRLHAVFYSQRSMNEWDAHYAVSFDYGETFENYHLSGADPNAPTLNTSQCAECVREYIGIDHGRSAVWTSVIGTLPADPATRAVYIGRVVFPE